MKFTSDLILAAVVVVLAASGTYMLLPHRHGAAKPRQVHLAGGILAAVAALLFALLWTPPGPFLINAFLYLFGIATLAAGLMTIVSRNPIYSALWFAAVVLASSGLFLLAGAQFLAVGTIIVYAGAIIVTFLFVIMLAQMEGRAPYDRSARAPFAATFTCYVLFFGLICAFFSITRPPVVPAGANPVVNVATATLQSDPRLTRTPDLAVVPDRSQSRAIAEVVGRASRPTAQLTVATGQEKPHVAGLGETLYTDHLITVELAGALLFVALVGALMIAAPKPPIRPGQSPRIGPVTAQKVTTAV